MNLTLRAGERLYLNGAVLRVDRKVTLELLNDATFLLQGHVLQAHEATTPLRQIYFAVQVVLMEPGAAQGAERLAHQLIGAALAAYRTPGIVAGLRAIADMLGRARHFEALKALRALYDSERAEMAPAPSLNPSEAA